jgi:hypothetical protein
MFVVAFVLLFKIWALCVKKRHLKDRELKLEYLWYVLLNVARRKRNAKISIVGLALGRDHLIVDYMVLKILTSKYAMSIGVFPILLKLVQFLLFA